MYNFLRAFLNFFLCLLFSNDLYLENNHEPSSNQGVMNMQTSNPSTPVGNKNMTFHSDFKGNSNVHHYNRF